MLSKQVVRFSKIKYILRRFPVLIDRVRNLLGKKSELDLYFKLINKEDIILDIGANTGQLTLPISHYLSNHGEIHSFEPVRMSFDELKRKITYEKPRSNVFLNNFAISDVDKNSIINYPISDLTQASLNKHDKHSWAKKNEIKSQRISLKKLDTYI
jgi:FkbM family methyltransferase